MPDGAAVTGQQTGGAAAAALADLRAAAARDGAPDAARRRALLARLAELTLARAEALAAAIDADFGGRDAAETLLAEAMLVIAAARQARRGLRRWMRPQRAAVPLHFWPASARILPTPKGVIGIMAPWNYPAQLALLPAIDAIAAGNRVVLKPSEATPRTAQFLADLLADALGPDMARTVQGGPEVAADFAAQPWDHLVFTGGTATGRRVMAAAAPHLTPLTLELGGKCPVLVLPGADLAAAAREILLGKRFNAGQTCVAPDTVLLVGHRFADFAAACRATGLGLPETVVVNAAQAARLDALAAGAELTSLAEAGPGRQRAIALVQAPADHPIHAAEVFGPLLPVVELPGLPAALAWVAARPAPLAVYHFGASAAEAATILAGSRSGAVVTGRMLDYAAMPGLAFGGVGGSGFGRRNAEAGFREFSNPRAVVAQGGWSLARLLDPPRSAGTLRLLRRLLR